MARLVEEGKVRYIGVSNFPRKICDVAIATCSQPILVNQVEHHPLLQQRTLRTYLDAHDIALVAYSPLGRGNLGIIPELTKIAQKYSVSVSQVALAWEISDGAIPIPKSSSEAHIADNFGALNLVLDDEDIESIDSMKVQKRFVNPPIIHPKWDL